MRHVAEKSLSKASSVWAKDVLTPDAGYGAVGVSLLRRAGIQQPPDKVTTDFISSHSALQYCEDRGSSHACYPLRRSAAAARGKHKPDLHFLLWQQTAVEAWF